VLDMLGSAPQLSKSDRACLGRYKFIRPDFQQAVTDSGRDWKDRPILPNRLMPGVDIFSPAGS
jgi:hypothetical protein